MDKKNKKEKDTTKKPLNRDYNYQDRENADPEEDAVSGMDITSRSGAETELGTEANVHHLDPNPADRLKRKEDLRRGLNNSNPNNQRNNSNTLNESE